MLVECGMWMVLAAGAAGQAEQPVTDPAPVERAHWAEDERWTIRMEPSIWYAGLSGEVKLPRASEDAGGNEATKLRDLGQNKSSKLTPLGEVTLRRGSWGFSVRGAAFSSEASAEGVEGMIGDVEIEDGDEITSSVDMINFEAEALYTLFKDARRPMEGGGFRFRPRVDLVFGVRVMQMEWAVQNDSAEGEDTATADEVAIHPTVGVRVGATFLERFNLDVQLAAGYMPFLGSSSYGLDILVGGSWQIIPHVGVQAGYRALFLGVASGDGDAEFEFQGALQGLYAGVVIEF